jgi:hypothetical protein
MIPFESQETSAVIFLGEKVGFAFLGGGELVCFHYILTFFDSGV